MVCGMVYIWCICGVWYGVYMVYGMVYIWCMHGVWYGVWYGVYMVYVRCMVWCMVWCMYGVWYGVWYGVCMVYSPYAKVFVKSETTPKNAIFDLLYLNHYNSPTIENPVVHTQLIIEQYGAFTY